MNLAMRQEWEDNKEVKGRAKSPVIRVKSSGGMPRLLRDILGQIEIGELLVKTPNGETLRFGKAASFPQATWIVHSTEAFDRCLQLGSLGLGEGYMDELWEVEHERITDFVGIILANDLRGKRRLPWLSRLRIGLQYLLNTGLIPSNAKRCVSSHYDLGNDFYRLWLDKSMTYSCAYAVTDDQSLEQMQQQKYDLIGQKLGLQRGGRLLDIGCGWGGMLLNSARWSDDLEGLGITLSKEQAQLAAARLKEAGLEQRFAVELCDYRYCRGSFDFISSIGMFEHVGRLNYGTFMRKMAELLHPEGTGLLHTIATADDTRLGPDPWTTRYIFPGGRLPRLEELCLELRRAGLQVGHVENLRPHYAITLRRWRESFAAARSEVQGLGPQYDRRFLRMWDYYLQAMEAAFRYGRHQLYQVLFCHDRRWPFPRSFGR